MKTPEQYWLARARGLAFRHNSARWLHWFLPCLVGTALAGAATLLVLREWRVRTDLFWPVLGGVAVLAAVVCLAILRGRTFSMQRALVRLDDAGHLHNRLTSAQAGVGPWPAPRAVADPAEWRWARLVSPGMFSIAILATSAWVPLPERHDRELPREQPLAWSEVQSWIDKLEQAKIADQPALEKLANQLEELHHQAPEQWFSQSSLEAGDNLRQQTEQALQNMQRDLQKSEEVLNQASQPGAQSKPDQLKKMEETLSQALQGLQMGNLPLNKELLKKLQDFKPGQQPSTLSKEQMDALRDRMEQGQKVCQQCVGGVKKGDQKGEQEGKMPGGEGGGGEEAPLSFNGHETHLKTTKTEDLRSDDKDNVLPADLAGLTAAQHEVKKEVRAPVDGGEIASPGQGGDAVWRNAVLPRERTILQRFFK